MSNDPVKPGEGADELLGRWFAHHDKAADEDGTAAPPRRTPIAARPSEAAAPRVTRPSASAALAELRDAPAVHKHERLGAATPPSTFGVRRGVPGSAHSGPTGAPGRGADGDVAELDRPSPVGFEPVILRSVRKKTQSKEEPEHKEKRGRLSRLRSRVAGPAEQPAPPEQEPPVALYDEPAAVVPPPVFKSSPPAPAAPPRKLVPYEDVIALATSASLPVAEPETPPEPQPEPAPEVEPVLPGPDTEPVPVVPEPEPVAEPEPVLPGPDTEPVPVVPEPEPDVPVAAVVEAPTKRRLVIRTKRPEPDEPGERKRPPLVARSATARNTGTGGAARGLLAAARAATPAPPLASEVREPMVLDPVPMLPVETVEPEPSAPPMEMPAVYEFTPRKALRRFLSLMLLVGLAASGYLDYGAYQSRDTVELGVAGIVTVATLVIWAIRAGATVTRLTVKSGQLEIVRQGARMVFDLASTYTAVEVTGKPGSKKWKVLFLRPGMAPVTVDSTMVDGREFMRILGFFRPGLA